MEGLHKSSMIVCKTWYDEHVRNRLYISLWLYKEHYMLTHKAQGLSGKRWPPEICIFFSKPKGCTSLGSCQANQQVPWLLLTAPSRLLISLFF